MDKLKIVIDTREQTPLVFPAEEAVTELGTLKFGDYSLAGMTDWIAIERKSLPDLVGCVGRERDRFEKEVIALRGFMYKAVVVEADLPKIEAGKWRGDILPQHVLGTIASWRIKYKIDFIYANSPELASREVLRLLRKFRDYVEDFDKRLKASAT